MENAARGLAELVRERRGRSAPGDSLSSGVLIAVGPGNNGGDGLAAARHLHNLGFATRCLLSRAPDAYTGDAAINLRIAERMGLDVRDVSHASAEGLADAAGEGWAVVVDALFGTGLGRPLEGTPLEIVRLIARLREAGSVVIAADIPSGLDCDTGQPLGEAVRADATAAFVGAKVGFVALGAQELVGDVIPIDIGAPRELVESLATGGAAPASTASRAEASLPPDAEGRDVPGREAAGH